MDRQNLLTESQIKKEYQVSGSALRFLPRPQARRKGRPLWSREAVEAAVTSAECKAHMEKVRAQLVHDAGRAAQRQENRQVQKQAAKAAAAPALKEAKAGKKRRRRRGKRLTPERLQRRLEEQRRRERAQAAREHLLQYDVSSLIRAARQMDRWFVIHCGPTNSGKTYAALQALKAAKTGCYLGPLRLLALEVFDTLNQAGVPCSLLTGEESIDIPFSYITASTIEMCDLRTPVDVAVIDEAQLIADRNRGGHWLGAILRVPASEVHICVAPEGLQMVENLLQQMDAPYTLEYHQRLTPLVYEGSLPAGDYRCAQPGDAFIAFSRKAVLAVAAELESLGIHASVIYGALPPPSRREEVRRFAQGENTVVVATDAIGMGVSLPIRRVIFCQTSKFDGLTFRPLTATEIKQIAGRAGRYGKYDQGLVAVMESTKLIENALAQPAEPVTHATIPFPSEALGYDFSLAELLEAWRTLQPVDGFSYEDMSEARILYRNLASKMGSELSRYNEVDVLRCITCPADAKIPAVVGYWYDLTCALLRNQEKRPKPWIKYETLDDCELGYKLLDVQYQLLRRAGYQIDVTAKKQKLEERINELLQEDKQDMKRFCTRCGKALEATARFNICAACQALQHNRP